MMNMNYDFLINTININTTNTLSFTHVYSYSIKFSLDNWNVVIIYYYYYYFSPFHILKKERKTKNKKKRKERVFFICTLDGGHCQGAHRLALGAAVLDRGSMPNNPVHVLYLWLYNFEFLWCKKNIHFLLSLPSLLLFLLILFNIHPSLIHLTNQFIPLLIHIHSLNNNFPF